MPSVAGAETISALDEARTLPAGAMWRKVALQVNPFAYQRENHPEQLQFDDEQAYNNDLVRGLLDNDIDVIGITDHHRASASTGLQQAATTAGITVLPGFETETDHGVHVLVLFDPGTSLEEVNRRIAQCESDRAPGRPLHELLDAAPGWGAVMVPAHVTDSKGLLVGTPTGRARIAAWQDAGLHGVAVSGHPQDQAHRRILDNTDPAYARDHPVTVIHACDIDAGADAAHAYAATWFKLSTVSACGLDLALRAGESRVRTAAPVQARRTRLVAMAWEGGFLGGVRLHFNAGLNVLIGGRGAGKTTVLESVRFVTGLSALTARGQLQQDQTVKDVLISSSAVHLLVEVVEPTRRLLRLERTVGGLARVVDDASGEHLPLNPAEVVSGLEIYGQRELAEIAGDASRQRELLRRFRDDSAETKALDDVRSRLEDNRRRQRDVLLAQAAVGERLGRLPQVESKLAAFATTGAPQALTRQRLLQREESLLQAAAERLSAVAEALATARAGAQIDLAFLDTAAVRDIADADLPEALRRVLQTTSSEVASALTAMAEALARGGVEIDVLRADWERRVAPDRAALDTAIRELSASGVQAADYLPLQRQRDELLPLTGELDRLGAELTALLEERSRLLAELEASSSAQVGRLRRAGLDIQKRLPWALRVSVTDDPHVDGMLAVLMPTLSGQTGKIKDLVSASNQSGAALATWIRQGPDALQARGLTKAQALSLAAVGEPALMELEQVCRHGVPQIEFNVGGRDAPVWRPLSALSAGQKATAVLLMILDQGEGPLLVDQPEDDLDNRFVTEGIVPQLRAAKEKRQFVLSTHNANIPVLADAELIAALSTEQRANRLGAVLPVERVGSLDEPRVRELVEEILEGGRAAFETRRYRYGF